MPPLSLITGPSSALDAALAAEIRTHKSANPLAPITVLVGGSLLRPFLRARLAALLDGHINVRVVTPAELALRLGEPGLIGGERSPITPLADRAVAQELARAATSYFEPVRETPGFANALHRLFGELRAASIDPEQFASASVGSADTKLAELAELYRGYLTARAPFYDAGDAMAGADAGRLDDHAVLVHGIWEMPARLRAMLEAVARTGARISELCGLTSANVRIHDLDDAEIEFGWQVDRRGNRGPSKTDRSARTVPIPPELAFILERHQRESHDTRPEAPVFATRTGRPLGQRNVARALRAAQTRARDEQGRPTFPILHERDPQERLAAVPRGAVPSMHSFRHTVASRALLAGESVDEVAFLLGHRDGNVTRSVYVREIADSRRRAMRRSRMNAEFAGVLEAAERP
jgi:hypothetical protein